MVLGWMDGSISVGLERMALSSQFIFCKRKPGWIILLFFTVSYVWNTCSSTLLCPSTCFYSISFFPANVSLSVILSLCRSANKPHRRATGYGKVAMSAKSHLNALLKWTTTTQRLFCVSRLCVSFLDDRQSFNLPSQYTESALLVHISSFQMWTPENVGKIVSGHFPEFAMRAGSLSEADTSTTAGTFPQHSADTWSGEHGGVFHGTAKLNLKALHVENDREM